MKKPAIAVILISFICATLFYNLFKSQMPSVPELPLRPPVQFGIDGLRDYTQRNDRQLAEFEEKADKVRETNFRIMLITLAIGGTGLVIGIAMLAWPKGRQIGSLS